MAVNNTVVDDGYKYHGYPRPSSHPTRRFLSFLGKYQDTLIACLTDNPRPVMFPVSCSGAAPRVVLEGPWDEALAKERDALEELGTPMVGGIYVSHVLGALSYRTETPLMCRNHSYFVVWRCATLTLV